MNEFGHSLHSKWARLKTSTADIIKSMGVVFGDIGTSPLYTLSTIFSVLAPTESNIFGVISLIIWTLVTLVFVEYAWLAMSLGHKGEGGMIVLKEILVPLLKTPRQVFWVTLLAFVGISLFIGDGVITPAVSILTAVEGILLIPCCKTFSVALLVSIAAFICILLFVVQQRGTERVGSAFGPIMLIWFSSLLGFGVFSILLYPRILYAINPYYAINFLLHHGYAGFFVLSAVILCATGGEALYADMGHLGRKPILRAWNIVFISLVCCYLGQGAFLLHVTQAKQVFFEMIFFAAPVIYIPFLILTIMATAIASQALISAIFSVVYQGIATHIIPMIKVDYTSTKLRSQVYIGFINWLLLLAVLFMIFHFKESLNLTYAYGTAVAGTMLITSILMTMIFYLKKHYFKSIISGLLILVNTAFFFATSLKLPYGGYWSLLIALVPLTIILIYTTGQKRLYALQKPIRSRDFIAQYLSVCETSPKLKGSALFFVRDLRAIPNYVAETLFEQRIIYENNILVCVVTRDDPFGVSGFFNDSLAEGLRVFEIHRGYMEIIDIEKILKNAGLQPQVIFYGLEDVVTKNIIWKIYATIKKLNPSFVKFYKLPPEKLHGVISVIEM